MRRLLILLTAALSLCGCAVLQTRNWDVNQLLTAASHATTAASLTDAQIVELSARTVAELDAKNSVEPATGPYTKRLAKILAGIDNLNGQPLNFKVYKTNEINAFACGDGSIRVYSGLMDIMSDDEVFAILGHEIGHVANKDSKRAMQNAYLTAAARNVAGAAGGTVGTLANSMLGDIAESYVSAQFSQKQEFNADDYGFQYSVQHGKDPYSMYNSLNKLMSASGGSKASNLQQMFSTHPDTSERAARMKAKADAVKK